MNASGQVEWSAEWVTCCLEVRAALQAGRPVVALESTIITHGMPWPQNATVALEVEQIIRDAGAVPATIAVIDGKIRIGLTAEEIRTLAQTADAIKLSLDNLAAALAMGKTGSTTVAATMACAHAAGIEVFATGGIGGVHRGSEQTGDVSADLEELSRTPVLVVCAGVKAILDLPRTLEYLETKGVPVIGYQSDQLAAFWSRDSGLQLPIRMETAEQVAAFMRVQRRFGRGAVLSNPVPAAAEIPRDEMEPFIRRALAAAAEQQVTAKAVTPFVLNHLLEATGGRSLHTNMSLIRHNAQVAAEIAVALSHGLGGLRPFS